MLPPSLWCRKHRLRDTILKNCLVLILYSIRSTKGHVGVRALSERAAVYVRLPVCARTLAYIVCVTIPTPFPCPSFTAKAVYASWGDRDLHKFECCLPANAVRGKQSFQRWREDQSALPSSPAIRVMCLLACRSYVLQVDKMHNPPHLIQEHVLSC